MKKKSSASLCVECRVDWKETLLLASEKIKHFWSSKDGGHRILRISWVEQLSNKEVLRRSENGKVS